MPFSVGSLNSRVVDPQLDGGARSNYEILPVVKRQLCTPRFAAVLVSEIKLWNARVGPVLTETEHFARRQCQDRAEPTG